MPTPSHEQSIAHAAQLISRATIGPALGRLRDLYAGDDRALKRLRNAELELTGASAWYISADGSELKIQSSTRRRDRQAGRIVWYTVTASGCSCKAGEHQRACRHLQAYEALAEAIKIGQQAAAQQVAAPGAARQLKQDDQQYQQTLDDVDELF